VLITLFSQLYVVLGKSQRFRFFGIGKGGWRENVKKRDGLL
jgi:hypothetical protein